MTPNMIQQQESSVMSDRNSNFTSQNPSLVRNVKTQHS